MYNRDSNRDSKRDNNRDSSGDDHKDNKTEMYNRNFIIPNYIL